MNSAPSQSRRLRTRQRGFTLVEIMISMAIVTTTMGLALSVFVFCLKVMYKDGQRLATNASMRSFMSQISKETLDASYFYLFPYYTSLDGSVDLTADPATLGQSEDYTDNDYDKWVAHGDCMVLVTKTSEYRTSDIRQIRIYYRTTTNTTSLKSYSTLRYYETADWGEGTSTTSNGHPVSSLATYLNAINLNSNPSLSGSKLISATCIGRAYSDGSGNYYPAFSSEAPSASTTSGFISINLEFVNGTTVNNMLSSSSFNYTISPRR
ncbi:MAG TPA: prepilin-type N-terminal cleavage/methylation domain-containing protein [Lacunisphaera sp.]|jgi:prepilin-type N-terminal cleavage/methylation domain-containing protein|nr:prepilin-type N-terminal cleavage/methylation domain-containing protein [Lacunisphaera sp.]